MFDFSFFALLFAVATSLAPADAREVTLVNVRHPTQRMTWTRGDDGRWAMTLNERAMGELERRDGAIFRHTGQRSPDHFPLRDLVEPPAPTARRVRLRGRFAPTVLHVQRRGGTTTLSDPSRELLRTDLRLEIAR
jgi:hypothetical protein